MKGVKRMTRWDNLPDELSDALHIEARKNKNNTPLEEEEQKKLAEYLDYQGYDWFHPFNEGKHKVQYRAKQKKLGLKNGIPDNIIFNAPKEYNGIVIELKRVKGGQLTDSQKKWLSLLESLGWLTKVAYGADEAIEFLEEVFDNGN